MKSSVLLRKFLAGFLLMAIAEIRVKSVRGIREEITIPLNGNPLLVHGDNGTGKSSIEKALRWALLGTEAPTDTEPFSDEASFRRHILEAADSGVYGDVGAKRNNA
jgi:DNA repair exonuclease SbcCD ATPase subunit